MTAHSRSTLLAVSVAVRDSGPRRAV